MLNFRQLLAALVLLAGLATIPAQAETFHTCGTIINTVPTVIATQGVYCLSHDVATAITTGNAIDIQANNVTLDCNGYKIGGLAAGSSSTASGIHADAARQNITVRNCGIRGFYQGINLQGGAGHLIEDNRLDNNLWIGIEVQGDNNRVRRNAVYDTGGTPAVTYSIGIDAAADVIDNTVAGGFASTAAGPDTYPRGITTYGHGSVVRGNEVSGLAVAGAGFARGILVYGFRTRVDGNHIALPVAKTGTGITGVGVSGTDTFCVGNTIGNFTTPMAYCQDVGGNASN